MRWPPARRSSFRGTCAATAVLARPRRPRQRPAPSPVRDSGKPMRRPRPKNSRFRKPPAATASGSPAVKKVVEVPAIGPACIGAAERGDRKRIPDLGSDQAAARAHVLHQWERTVCFTGGRIPPGRSELLVGSVAVWSFSGALALAQPRFFRRVCGEGERRECRAFVGSVAHRLRFGFPAAAPIVGLAGFELYRRGLTSCDLWVCHGFASSVPEPYAGAALNARHS